MLSAVLYGVKRDLSRPEGRPRVGAVCEQGAEKSAWSSGEAVTRGPKMHIDRRHKLYACASDIIMVLKSRSMRWKDKCTCSRGEIRRWSENVDGKDHSENLSIDGRIILRRFF
jgi:hypothetical protein